MRKLKIAVIGDKCVGKFTLIHSYLDDECARCQYNREPDFYYFKSGVMLDFHIISEYNVELCKTEIDECDCYIFCYSIVCRESFNNIRLKWLPELGPHLKKTVPIILVATKWDQRFSGTFDSVRNWEGEILKNRIGAIDYVECSARDDTNVNLVFESMLKSCNVKFDDPSDMNCVGP